jgi:hypothetical protein
MIFGAPTREELLVLHGKYVQIEELRRARERGDVVPERAVFKTLAEQFPGVLRELDTLPMPVIEARRQALSRVLEGETSEPWMAWIVAYHALMRAALWIKLRTAKQPDLDAERAALLALRIQREFGFGVDEQFVVDVARPQMGRINVVVLRRLEKIFAVSASEIREAIFCKR